VNHTEILELKNTMSMMKNAKRVSMVDLSKQMKKICELKDSSFKDTQTDRKKKRQVEKE
jgi:hypothetical protein